MGKVYVDYERSLPLAEQFIEKNRDRFPKLEIIFDPLQPAHKQLGVYFQDASVNGEMSYDEWSRSRGASGQKVHS